MVWLVSLLWLRSVVLGILFDFSKLARMFPDLEFDWNAERGAHELVDAYREVGLTREEFDGDPGLTRPDAPGGASGP